MAQQSALPSLVVDLGGLTSQIGRDAATILLDGRVVDAVNALIDLEEFEVGGMSRVFELPPGAGKLSDGPVYRGVCLVRGERIALPDRAEFLAMRGLDRGGHSAPPLQQLDGLLGELSLQFSHVFGPLAGVCQSGPRGGDGCLELACNPCRGEVFDVPLFLRKLVVELIRVLLDDLCIVFFGIDAEDVEVSRLANAFWQPQPLLLAPILSGNVLEDIQVRAHWG